MTDRDQIERLRSSTDQLWMDLEKHLEQIKIAAEILKDGGNLPDTLKTTASGALFHLACEIHLRRASRDLDNEGPGP